MFSFFYHSASGNSLKIDFSKDSDGGWIADLPNVVDATLSDVIEIPALPVPSKIRDRSTRTTNDAANNYTMVLNAGVRYIFYIAHASGDQYKRFWTMGEAVDMPSILPPISIPQTPSYVYVVYESCLTMAQSVWKIGGFSSIGAAQNYNPPEYIGIMNNRYHRVSHYVVTSDSVTSDDDYSSFHSVAALSCSNTVVIPPTTTTTTTTTTTPPPAVGTWYLQLRYNYCTGGQYMPVIGPFATYALATSYVPPSFVQEGSLPIAHSPEVLAVISGSIPAIVPSTFTAFAVASCTPSGTTTTTTTSTTTTTTTPPPTAHYYWTSYAACPGPAPDPTFIILFTGPHAPPNTFVPPVHISYLGNTYTTEITTLFQLPDGIVPTEGMELSQLSMIVTESAWAAMATGPCPTTTTTTTTTPPPCVEVGIRINVSFPGFTGFMQTNINNGYSNGIQLGDGYNYYLVNYGGPHSYAIKRNVTGFSGDDTIRGYVDITTYLGGNLPVYGGYNAAGGEFIINSAQIINSGCPDGPVLQAPTTTTTTTTSTTTPGSSLAYYLELGTLWVDCAVISETPTITRVSVAQYATVATGSVISLGSAACYLVTGRHTTASNSDTVGTVTVYTNCTDCAGGGTSTTPPPMCPYPPLCTTVISDGMSTNIDSTGTVGTMIRVYGSVEFATPAAPGTTLYISSSLFAMPIGSTFFDVSGSTGFPFDAIVGTVPSGADVCGADWSVSMMTMGSQPSSHTINAACV